MTPGEISGGNFRCMFTGRLSVSACWRMDEGRRKGFGKNSALGPRRKLFPLEGLGARPAHKNARAKLVSWIKPRVQLAGRQASEARKELA